MKKLYILALGLLLTLGACEKKTSSNDPSTPEGKIEMAIAALNTDGEKLMNKLEQKGWDWYEESSYYYDDHFIYTKGDNEMCEILLAYDEVYVVSWINRYKSFSDAVTAYCDYHDTAESKAKDEYDGQVYGSREEFVKPSELKKYIKNATESDLKNKEVVEGFINTKKGYGIFLELLYYDNSWIISASIGYDYGS